MIIDRLQKTYAEVGTFTKKKNEDGRLIVLFCIFQYFAQVSLLVFVFVIVVVIFFYLLLLLLFHLPLILLLLPFLLLRLLLLLLLLLFLLQLPLPLLLLFITLPPPTPTPTYIRTPIVTPPSLPFILPNPTPTIILSPTPTLLRLLLVLVQNFYPYSYSSQIKPQQGRAHYFILPSICLHYQKVTFPFPLGLNLTGS